MLIQFACKCGKKLQADEQYAGKQAPCPECGAPITVPLTEPSDAILPARPRCAETRAVADEQNTSKDGNSGKAITHEQFPCIPQRNPQSGFLIAIVSGLLFGAGMGIFAAIKQGPETGLGAGLFCALSFGPIMGFVLRGIKIVASCQDPDQLAGDISRVLVGMKYQLAQESRGCLEFQHTNGGIFPQWAAVSLYFQNRTAVIVGPAWYVKKLKRRLPTLQTPVGATEPARQDPSFHELVGRAFRNCLGAILAIDGWLGRMLGEENALLHKFLRVLLTSITCVIGIWLLSLAWQFASSAKSQRNTPAVVETPKGIAGEGAVSKPARPTDPDDPRNLIIGKWRFVEGGGGTGEAYFTFGADGVLALDLVLVLNQAYALR